MFPVSGWQNQELYPSDVGGRVVLCPSLHQQHFNNKSFVSYETESCHS